jgi:hypothetical protein
MSKKTLIPVKRVQKTVNSSEKGSKSGKKWEKVSLITRLLGSWALGNLGSWALGHLGSWAPGLLGVEPGNDVAKQSLSKFFLAKKLKNACAFYNFLVKILWTVRGRVRGGGGPGWVLLGSWALGLMSSWAPGSWALGRRTMGNDVAKRSSLKKILTKKLKNASAFFNFLVKILWTVRGRAGGGSWALGLMGSWTQGHLSSWPQVLFGSWAHGLMDSWAHGHLGSWAQCM